MPPPHPDEPPDLLLQATAAVRARTARQPKVGLVLGSGLGDLAHEVEGAVAIPYRTIPGFPTTSVSGHAGVLVMGTLEAVGVAVLAGRSHFYEHGDMRTVAFPVRLLHALGCQAFMVTNAAGGLHPDFVPGDLMLITDHISLPALVGLGPLVGHGGDTRFVDMGDAYDEGLRAVALRVAQRLGLGLRQGVYAQVGGPHYETPAEVRLLRAVGADAVGMSTTAEVIVARQLGMRVLGLSGITNVACALSGVSHAQVLAGSQALAEHMRRLLHGILAELGRGETCGG